MAIEIKHATQTAEPNDPAYDVSADAWNEAHDLTLAASRLVGRYAATPGAAQEIIIGSGLSLDSGTGVLSAPPPAVEAFPVGSVFIAVVATNPATLLGYGTWVAFGAGRVLVGLDAGDADFDVEEETGGAKTVASAGTNANESAHTHTYTEVPNHTHPVNVSDPGHNHTQNAHTHTQTVNSAATGGLSGYTADTSTNTPATSGYSTGSTTATNNANTTGITATTSNPTGGVATGTTAAGSAHSHTFTGSPTSVVQPYIVVRFWKRTA